MLFTFFLIYLTAFNQKPIEPLLENYSKTSIEIIKPLVPGEKNLFRQSCIKGYHETIPTGIVQFHHLQVGKDNVNTIIEFKDTIVEKLIFRFNLSADDALSHFHIQKDQFIKIKKNQSFQSFQIDHLNYNCFLNRKEIVLVVQNINE